MFNFLKKKEEIKATPPLTMPDNKSKDEVSAHITGGGFFNLPAAGGDIDSQMKETSTSKPSSNMFSGLDLVAADGDEANITTATTATTSSSSAFGFSFGESETSNNTNTNITSTSQEPSAFGFDFGTSTSSVTVSEPSTTLSGGGFDFISSSSSSNNNNANKLIVPPIDISLLNTAVTPSPPSPVESVRSVMTATSTRSSSRPSVTNINIRPKKVVKKKRKTKRPGWAKTIDDETPGKAEKTMSSNNSTSSSSSAAGIPLKSSSGGGVTSLEDFISDNNNSKNNNERSLEKRNSTGSSILDGLTIRSKPSINELDVTSPNENDEDASSVIEIPIITASDTTTTSSTSVYDSSTRKISSSNTDALTSSNVVGTSDTVDSSEEKLAVDEFKSNISVLGNQLRQFHDQLQELKDRQNNERDLKVRTEINLDSCILEQSKAIEGEDYDKADVLNGEIETTKDAILTHEDNIISISNAISQLQSIKGQLWDDQITLISRTAIKLNDLTSFCSNELDSFKRKSKQTIERTERSLLKMGARCEVKLKSVLQDETEAAQDRSEIENSIKEEVGAFQEEMGNISATCMGLETDVADLRAKLAKKEEELEKARRLHAEIDDSISDVRRRYGAKLAHLDATENSLAELRQTLTTEKNEVENGYQDLKELRKEHTVSIENMNTDIDQLNCKVKLSKLFEDELIAQKENEMNDSDETLLSDGGNNGVLESNVDSKEIAILNDKLKLIASSIKEKENILNSCDSQIAGLISEMSLVEVKLPTLAAEKQKAVAARSFKDAGRINKEIQALKDQKHNAENCISEMKEVRDNTNLSLIEVHGQRDSLNEQLRKYEEEVDRVKIDSLRVTVSSCMNAVAKIKSCLSSDASSPSFIFGSSLIEMLEIESSTNRNELETLCTKHNLSDLIPSVGTISDNNMEDGNIESADEVSAIATARARSDSEIKNSEIMLEEKRNTLLELHVKLDEAMGTEEYEECDSIQEQINNLDKDVNSLKILIAQDHELRAIASANTNGEVEVIIEMSIDEALNKKKEFECELGALQDQIDVALSEEDFELCDSLQPQIDTLQSNLSDINEVIIKIRESDSTAAEENYIAEVNENNLGEDEDNKDNDLLPKEDQEDLDDGLLDAAVNPHDVEVESYTEIEDESVLAKEEEEGTYAGDADNNNDIIGGEENLVTEEEATTTSEVIAEDDDEDTEEVPADDENNTVMDEIEELLEVEESDDVEADSTADTGFSFLNSSSAPVEEVETDVLDNDDSGFSFLASS